MPAKKENKPLVANQQEIENPKELNIVLQKEYLIIEPRDLHPILATESVRSCYAVLIYHPKKSAILHWDDNICHSEIDLYVNKFLGDDLQFKDCTVHLIGGWNDHLESRKSGEFLKNYFSKTNLILEHYQKKKSTGSLAAQGFSLVSMDSRTGKVFTQNNWEKGGVVLNDDKYRGEDTSTRFQNFKFLDLTHLQDDQYPDSGTRIIPRDNFFTIQSTQANQLCVAAKNNSIDLLIKYIDEGITHVNASPKNAKGWTPLHYACKFGNYDAAQLLINNGANLYQKNEAGKSAHDQVTDLFRKRQLQDAYRLVNYNMSMNEEALVNFSMFSRHPERIKQNLRTELSKVNHLLDTSEGLTLLEGLLP